MFRDNIGGKLYFVWNLFVVIAVTYCTVSIPFSVAIYESSTIYLYREIALTLIFSLDILISLIRIRRKASFMHIEHSALQVFYRRWIVIDIIAAIPFSLIFGISWLQLIRLVKAIKVFYLIQMLRQLMAHISNVILMLQLLFWATIATHWLSCGWISLRGLDHDLDLFTNYVNAVYWTVSTLTTVGYGDMTPVNTNERMYAILTMIFGYSFFGYLIGSFAGILSKKDPIREKYNENLDKLTNAARYANLPLDLQRRIFEYFRYQMTRRVGYDEESFINELPSSMRGEVSLYFRKEVIENVSLFDDAPQQFIFDIAQQLHESIAAPDEYIFKAGDYGKQMFLIAHGSVDVYNSEETQVLRTLSEGDYFGEIALFQDVPRTATIKAATYCDLYSLNKQTFEATLKNYPKIAARIKQKAVSRSKNLPSLDD